MMKEKLLFDKQLLKKQLFWIEISYNKSREIGIKDQYSIDEFGHLETLCSRYARGIDFLIRKIFRTLDEYEFENQGTLVDVVNNAHKRGLFDSIENLRIMKDVRNTIVHEYIEDELVKVFADVFECTGELVKIIKATLKYMENIEKLS